MNNQLGTRRHPPTVAQEVAWACRIEAGVYAAAVSAGLVTTLMPVSRVELNALAADGEAAFEELVNANTGLVWYVVGPVAQRTGLDRAELAQEGTVGLLEAVRRFDPVRGRFASFALVYIRARVGDAAATALGGLGLPVKRAHAWWQVRGVAIRMSGELNREATAAEIAVASGRPLRQVVELLAWEPAQALPEDGVRLPAPADPIPDTSRDLLWQLTPQERRIMAYRYGFTGPGPQSYAAIAAQVGMSEATVRRRERAALATLRRQLGPDALVA
ncbi:MAG: sigma-70 family RNA polymerase sigma factor [Propioniciclava sp.]